ncbi:MAG: Dabb family protein [Candidatus Dormibacteraceae bacterium]
MTNGIQGIQHAVLFQFPRELSSAEEGEMAARIRAWPDKIGGFRRLRFGPDRSGRSRGYQYLLLAEFPDEEAMARYLPHPVHKAFAEWVHERGSQELAFDYVLDENTALLDEGSGTLPG